MAWTANDECIKVVFLDQAIHVDIARASEQGILKQDAIHLRERLSSIASPVTQQAGFEVLLLERFLKQWVLFQVEHAQAEV